MIKPFYYLKLANIIMDFFKKAFIGIMIGLVGLALVITGLTIMEKSYQSKSITYIESDEITINPRRQAFTPMILAPYKTMDVYLSDIKEADFPFTSVGITWDESTPEGTNIEVDISFFTDNSWTDWIEVEGEDDLINPTPEPGFSRKTAFAASNESDSVKYRIRLYGDGINKPVVKNQELTLIKAAKTLSITPPAKPKYSSYDPLALNSYIASNSNGSIISRSDWGAEETYRYMSNNDIDPVLIEISDEYYQKFKDELTYSRVIKEDSLGDKYRWPLQYPEKVKKFIIHHTATTSNLDNPNQAIRDIYYYHANTRGWGDIGYNYIIDQDGRIYEGRFGGEGVIGAHAGPGNNGSIGIAVLGNFEDNEVPEKIVNALSRLIAEKSKIHNIAPLAKSTFRGENMDNIFGHKDIMSTNCPGSYLYEKLPLIRSLANKYLNNKQKEKFVKDYDYQDLTDIYYLELKPDESREITLSFENIGTEKWDSSTFIVVDRDPAFEGVVSFPTRQEAVLAKLNETEVKSGDKGTFTFKVKGGKSSDLVYLNIAPLFNGTKKSTDYTIIPVNVLQVDYKYDFVDAKFPAKSMEKGETFSGWVKLKNTGNVTWRKEGENTIKLGTDHERDRKTLFLSPPDSRIGYLQENEVKPGELGTFSLNIKAPQQAGYYKEYFTPVIENVTWLNDSGMYFETTVFGEEYEAEVIETLSSKQWKQGGKYLIKIKLRNLGTKSWTPSNLKLEFIKEIDLNVTQAKLLSEKVESGGIGTISFVTEVSPNEKLEEKTILIRPKVDGNALLDRPIYIYYQVVEQNKITADDIKSSIKTPLNINENTDNNSNADTGSKTSTDIRVKLSFEGDPDITANGSYQVYDNQDLLTTLNPGEITTVTESSDKYLIKTPDATFEKNGPIRFLPKNSAIMRIENYDHSPAWNPDINDNEYRGILEVREDEDQLIVINELPLEDYLKGLGEVSNDELYEKIKAIIIAARSYAKYYTDLDQKFPGKPYHLNDDPDFCQKYLGYGFEKRASNIVKAVNETSGEVVTYDNQIVKTPYFNQSDGTYTKNALTEWNWDAPFLVSVSDAYCDGDQFLGHGVGLSGCGARGMAKQGYNYQEILKHYYTDIKIQKVY